MKLFRALIAILLICGTALTFVPLRVGAASIYIAASDSSGPDKAAATAVCAGTHDENTINTYLVAGNVVELFAGTYNINGTLALDSGLRLYGQGNTSIINLQSNYISCYNDSNVEIDHLELTGTGAGYAIIIEATSTNISNYSIHDIYCSVTGANDFEVYLAGHQASNFLFSNVDADTPDGNGFCTFATGDTGNVTNNFTFYKCSVENAGVAGSRIGNWITGFDIGENIVVGHETYVTINNSYYINCTVNGAWESDYHMEYGTTSTNVVFTGCDAQNAGQKPTPDAGYGFKTNPTSEAIEYQNTASTNTGGDLYLNGSTYTPIINGISPTGSTKVAQTVSQGNCRGVIITTSTNTYELVLYTSNSSPVSQTLTLPNSTTYGVNFTSYYVGVGIVGSGAPTVATGSASSITAVSASIGEQITALGASDVTAWGTNYGLTSSYGSHITNSGDINSGQIPYSWLDPLSGLVSASVYHYQASATNGSGAVGGADATFLTLPGSPGSLTATPGNGQVSLNWTKATPGSGVTVYTQIQFGTSLPTSYSDGTTGISWTTATSGSVSSGLTNGITYYFAAFSKAVSGALTTYSVAYVQVTSTPFAGGPTTTPTTTVPPSGAVANPDSIAIPSVRVFQNVFESGDQLYIVEVNAAYATVPSLPPQSTFFVAILDPTTGTVEASRPMDSYNHFLSAIYLTPTQALPWDPATPYVVVLSGNPTYFPTLTLGVNEAATTLSSSQYVTGTFGLPGTTPALLNAWCLTLAAAINPTWVDATVTPNVLATPGAVAFLTEIPNLGNVCPTLFSTSAEYPTYIPGTASKSEETALQARVGTRLQTAMTNLGIWMGMGPTLGGPILETVCIALLVFMVAGGIFVGTGSTTIAFVVGVIPTIFAGNMIGLLPLTLTFVLAFIVVLTFGVTFILSHM